MSNAVRIAEINFITFANHEFSVAIDQGQENKILIRRQKEDYERFIVRSVNKFNDVDVVFSSKSNVANVYRENNPSKSKEIKFKFKNFDQIGFIEKNKKKLLLLINEHNACRNKKNKFKCDDVRTLDNSVSLVLYTDGSFSNQEKKAGAGIVITQNECLIAQFGVNFSSTVKSSFNSEIQAIIESLKLLKQRNLLLPDIHGLDFFEIRTDNLDFVECINAYRKEKNDKSKAKYPNYIRKIARLCYAVKKLVKFSWVQSHNDNYFNDKADEIARDVCKMQQEGLFLI